MTTINTLNHLAFELKMRLPEIEYIIKNLKYFYYQVEEPKLDRNGIVIERFGKPVVRTLHPSVKRLKIIQKRIQNNLLLKLTIPEYAYGGIKDKDNIKNAKQHQGKKFIFTTDLRSFYPSINNKMVFETFTSLGYSPTVARYLTKLTTFKGKLPQGAPTSPLLANLVFVKTGSKLAKFALEHNLIFTSFVDDLTFSSPVDFKSKVPLIIQTIIDDGYKISQKKTNYKTKKPIVTGVMVKNNHLDLTERLKLKLANTAGKNILQIEGLKNYTNRILSS